MLQNGFLCLSFQTCFYMQTGATPKGSRLIDLTATSQSWKYSIMGLCMKNKTKTQTHTHTHIQPLTSCLNSAFTKKPPLGEKHHRGRHRRKAAKCSLNNNSAVQQVFSTCVTGGRGREGRGGDWRERVREEREENEEREQSLGKPSCSVLLLNTVGASVYASHVSNYRARHVFWPSCDRAF